MSSGRGRLRILFFLAFSLNSSHALTSVSPRILDPDQLTIDNPDSIVQGYLAAVDRGELIVFGRRLERSMITPARIEYVYDIFKRTTKLKIYSVLKDPMPVPNQQDAFVWGVSAVIESDSIIQTESHIWLKP